MELAFQTKALRELCENADKASSEFGVEVAAALRRRLADLRAAVSLSDMIVGDPNVNGEHVSIQIGDSHRLHLTANHVTNPMAPDGGIDWSAVTRLKVLEMRRSAE